MKPNKTIKHGRFVKWTFQGKKQAEAIARAEIGRSNLDLRSATHFTNNEINYALGKAQKEMGLRGGFRKRWANGQLHNKQLQQFSEDWIAIRTAEIQRTLPQQILKPEPDIVKV